MENELTTAERESIASGIDKILENQSDAKIRLEELKSEYTEQFSSLDRRVSELEAEQQQDVVRFNELNKKTDRTDASAQLALRMCQQLEISTNNTFTAVKLQAAEVFTAVNILIKAEDDRKVREDMRMKFNREIWNFTKWLIALVISVVLALLSIKYNVKH